MAGLSGKVALVTGGARGIGRATAIRLGCAGAGVAVVDVNGEGAEETAILLVSERGAKALPFACDISSSAQVGTTVSEVESMLGPVNVLVNAAGIFEFGRILDIDEQRWDRMLAVNLKGAFLMTRAVLPGMIRSGYGRIVNVSSMAGKVGGVFAGVHYAASKGGMMALTKAVARDVARHGITANCVCPYLTDTDMAAQFSVEQRRDMAERNPMGRLATPEDVADAIAFLASDEARFVSAEMMDVDGGYMAD